MAVLNIYDGNAFLAIGTYGFGRKNANGEREPLTWGGFPTGGMYHLLRHLIKNMYDYNIIVFDSKTRRKEIDPSYKANRTGDKTPIIAQQAIMVNYLEKAGFHVIKREGFEGDDLIRKAVIDNLKLFPKIHIHTNDMDIACNIDLVGCVEIYAPTRLSRSVNRDNYFRVVNNDYNVPYNMILPFKVFMGDKSDHILSLKSFDGYRLFQLFTQQIPKIFKNPEKYSDRSVMDWFISVLEKSLPEGVIKELRMRADLIYPIIIDEDLTTSKRNIDTDVLLSVCKMFGMKSLVKMLTKEAKPNITLTKNELYIFNQIRQNYDNGFYSIDSNASLQDLNSPPVKLNLIGDDDEDLVIDVLDTGAKTRAYLGENIGNIE